MFADVVDLKNRKIRVNLMKVRAISQDENGNAIFEYEDKIICTKTSYGKVEEAIKQIETYYCF